MPYTLSLLLPLFLESAFISGRTVSSGDTPSEQYTWASRVVDVTTERTPISAKKNRVGTRISSSVPTGRRFWRIKFFFTSSQICFARDVPARARWPCSACRSMCSGECTNLVLSLERTRFFSSGLCVCVDDRRARHPSPHMKKRVGPAPAEHGDPHWTAEDVDVSAPSSPTGLHRVGSEISVAYSRCSEDDDTRMQPKKSVFALLSTSPHRAEMERERVQQMRRWTHHREFFASSRNLLRMLKKFEEHTPEFQSCKPLGSFYVEQRDNLGATVLHVAILCNSVDVAKYLIETYPLPDLINAQYTKPRYQGETALHLATVKNQFELVRLLVQHGADVNAKAVGEFFQLRNTGKKDGGVYFGSSPLCFAVCSKNRDMVAYLLDHGADIRDKDLEGNTALHIAVLYDLPEVYDLLLEYDEWNLEAEANNDGLTPMKLCVQTGNLPMLKHILERTREISWSFGPVTEYLYPLHSIDTHQGQKETRTPGALELAVQGGTLEHCRMLQTAPMKQLLEEKWSTFAKTFFMAQFITYVLTVLLITVLALKQPAAVTYYSGSAGSARLAGEIFVLIVVVLDTALLALPDLLLAIFRPNKGYRTLLLNSPIYELSSWSFRMAFLTVFSARLAGAGENIQRTTTGVFVLTAWLYLLNLSRGFELTGRFLMLIERMVYVILEWSVVYVVMLVGFAAAFEVMFRDKAISGFDNYGLTLVSLLQYTLGQVEYVDVASASWSTFVSAIIFLLFVVLSVIVLFNLLIAIMTSKYSDLVHQAQLYAYLSWASQIVMIERRLWRKSWRDHLRSGRRGEDCGVAGASEGFYKAVIIVDETAQGGIVTPTLVKSTMHLGGSTTAARGAKFCEFFANEAVKNQFVMKPYAEIREVVGCYDKSGVMSREAVHFLLDDFFVLSGEPSCPLSRKEVDEIAAALDGDDVDNRINLEAIYMFLRLWRRTQLAPSLTRKRRAALVIMGMQNDYIDGSMKIEGAQKVVEKINQLVSSLPPSCAFTKVIVIQELHQRGSVIFGTKEQYEQTKHECRPEDVLFPEYCIEGTRGADICLSFTVRPDHVVKDMNDPATRNSFSGFWQEINSTETELHEILFDHHIDSVFVVGLPLDTCVNRTARDSRVFGFDTYLIEDASLPLCVARSRESALQLARLQVKSCTSDQVPAILQQGADVQQGLADLMGMHSMQQRRFNSLKHRYSLASMAAHSTRENHYKM
eukprot:m.229603 g.229603  ORF g.229603 m.229603 type:complete len:1208 (-) comp22401_c4_seq2:48-3671(-)